MRVRDLPLSDELVAHYEAQGIDELYPPQAAAVEAGVCDGGGVVAAIPTASGKTFIAELAMLTADGPGLYVVPLRALAREKYEAFAELPGIEAGISTGDFDSPGEELADYDVVVATSEKVDSAIRNGASWVEQLASVVVDEVHLLGAEGRGPTLEVTLATLQRRAPGLQIVALSATVDNPEDIADWLGAELVRNRWRPIDLRTGVYCEEEVRFDDGTDLTVDCDSGELPPSADADTEATAALVADAVAAGGQALAFVRSRREAESLARRLAQDGLGSASDVADEVLDAGATETGERLADALDSGVAFHHAGLRSDHRVAVENGFRRREISVICATPTLAAGVNVPARRVVIRDQKRYTGSEMAWLPVLEVHQMCGRAGRPHLDPYGEAVLVGDENTRDELQTRYVDAEPEAVESKLADREALRTHVLSVVASEFADSRESILELLGATFYAHQTPDMDLSGVVDAVISDLVSMEMIADEETLSATELGAQVSRQYLSPETGTRIVSGLRTAAEMETTTELTALEIVCDTPDMHGTYLGNRERAAMYQYATKHAAEFTTKMGETESFERWLEAVKTARILHDWVEDVPARDIVDAYRIGPGDLESRIERAEWLLGGADALSNVVGVSMPHLSSVRARL
ncbi:DEAD/DEAH box helicase [Haloprofundus marisrubri]|uniref:ATP-dependent DNA helicase Hel308 n=1 Tax=Haloprofundus marisrubri TaxID=1514971 RepID=A0A0W1R9R7_9EURY|nr:DEAD/DEAH box helicase [Haloprofundus marisrubri]KTG10065.1 DEAD/DEAH box helicase [Haloprofundus marisrubri]